MGWGREGQELSDSSGGDGGKAGAETERGARGGVCWEAPALWQPLARTRRAKALDGSHVAQLYSDRCHLLSLLCIPPLLSRPCPPPLLPSAPRVAHGRSRASPHFPRCRPRPPRRRRHALRLQLPRAVLGALDYRKHPGELLAILMTARARGRMGAVARRGEREDVGGRWCSGMAEEGLFAVGDGSISTSIDSWCGRGEKAPRS